MPFDALDAIDYAILVAVSAMAGLMLARWRELALAVAAALVIDLAAMALVFVLGGAAPWTAVRESVARFTETTGDVLILRAALYAAAIGAVFALKSLYRRR